MDLKYKLAILLALGVSFAIVVTITEQSSFLGSMAGTVAVVVNYWIVLLVIDRATTTPAAPPDAETVEES